MRLRRSCLCEMETAPLAVGYIPIVTVILWKHAREKRGCDLFSFSGLQGSCAHVRVHKTLMSPWPFSKLSCRFVATNQRFVWQAVFAMFFWLVPVFRGYLEGTGPGISRKTDPSWLEVARVGPPPFLKSLWFRGKFEGPYFWERNRKALEPRTQPKAGKKESRSKIAARGPFALIGI